MGTAIECVHMPHMVQRRKRGGKECDRGLSCPSMAGAWQAHTQQADLHGPDTLVPKVSMRSGLGKDPEMTCENWSAPKGVVGHSSP